MQPTHRAADDLEAQRLALRQQFLLRPDVIFLNHGSFGACPRPVFEVYQAWQLELECEPVEFLGRRFTDRVRHAREVLATYVGAAADELVYVPNATTGLNIVARSLPLQPGDEVLATDHEYGALDRTWRFVCGRRGARYLNQPLPLPLESPEQVVETLWSAVTEHTRVLFLSHITSPTALILPIAEVVRRARQAGIVTVIDGAHAPGQIPLDLTALGADFYAGNCHKWLCAPKGSAFLYARRDMQHLVQPLVVSWGWEEDRPHRSRRPVRSWVEEQEWQGTRDPAAYLSVPAAIQFQAERDWPRVRAECHELLREARRRIEELGRSLAPPMARCSSDMLRTHESRNQVSARNLVSMLCPDSLEWYARMASFPLPPCDAAALQRRLYDECRVEVPVIEWSGRQLVRVSVQGYNTAEDVAALAEALKEVVPLAGHGGTRG